MKLARCHLVVGVIGLLAFLLTGQYMDIAHNHLVDMDDGPRLIYRSTHIYLLLVSCLNVFIGVYMKEGVHRVLQAVISTVILLAPLLMLIEFFYGTRDVNTMRVYAYYSLITTFAVTCLSLVYVCLKKRQ